MNQQRRYEVYMLYGQMSAKIDGFIIAYAAELVNVKLAGTFKKKGAMFVENP